MTLARVVISRNKDRGTGWRYRCRLCKAKSGWRASPSQARETFERHCKYKHPEVYNTMFIKVDEDPE